MRVLIGSYGDEVAAYTFADQILKPSGPRVWTPAPSFLAVHPSLPIVYGVSEVDEGAVVAFRLDENAITSLGGVPSGGKEPCHLLVTADGQYVVCVNYRSGSVATFALRVDGSLQWRTDLVQHTGSGPHPVRQTGPHCHEVVADGELLHVVDLGTDHIVHYGLSDDGRLQARGASPARPAMAPGTWSATRPAGTSSPTSCPRRSPPTASSSASSVPSRPPRSRPPATTSRASCCSPAISCTLRTAGTTRSPRSRSSRVRCGRSTRCRPVAIGPGTWSSSATRCSWPTSARTA